MSPRPFSLPLPVLLITCPLQSGQQNECALEARVPSLLAALPPPLRENEIWSGRESLLAGPRSEMELTPSPQLWTEICERECARVPSTLH